MNRNTATGVASERRAGPWLTVLAAAAVVVVVAVASLGTLEQLMLLVGLCVVAGAGVVLSSSFTVFLCLAIVLRPLLDLMAGPRQDALSVTELFGASILAVSVGWLLLNWQSLAERMTERLPVALVAFTVVLGLSALGAPSIGAALPVVVRVAAGVVIFLTIELLLARGALTLRTLVAVLAAAAAVPLAYPLLGLVGVPTTHVKDGIVALKSVFYLSNSFAYFLVPYIVVLAAWVVHANRHRLVAAGLFAVAVVELILTQTRGAWFAAAIGLGVVGVLLSRRLLMALTATAVAAALFVPSVNARLVNLIPNPDDPRTNSSFAWRLDHWERLAPMVAESPLLGIGPGGAIEATGKEPHSDVVRAVVETGLLGLIVYVWLLFEALRLAYRVVRRFRASQEHSEVEAWLPDRGVVALVTGLSAYIVAFCVGQLGDNLIDNVTLLWGLMPALAILRWSLDAPVSALTMTEPEAHVRASLNA